MRYFLMKTFPEPTLSFGILKAACPTRLVFLAGPAKRSLPGLPGTTFQTITLATIAGLTDQDLGMASTTLKQTCGH